ncbi:hypothetical protein N0V83_007938 [Neocucurbitaria cava]|uniref:Uncharacterized protein n=1 Tax=Neocucurbitaria cava TaxID=798079 RepID=A0A9W9CK24_9PLEO|nr:hypothetical protein N0V83_007938 [Neocucurbitaria cava]
MPIYYARGISASLGTTCLEGTITRDIVLRKGPMAKQQCNAAEKKLTESEPLLEELVRFPGDEVGLALNWLGNAPFMQVQAGQQQQDSLGRAGDTSGQIAYGRLSTNEHHDDDEAKALVLHIHLSDKAFVSGLGNTKLHLKIEVFFNGRLSSCLFLPAHDKRGGPRSNHLVFAGTRIDFLAERPWVFLPPGVTADGNVRMVNKPTTVQQQWQDLCRELQDEADQRGKDKHGHIPPSAEFLTALAKMQMPAQVGGMQKPNGRRFGVIDVVISAGNGRKVTSGTSYLKAPQRLIDENYPLQVEKIIVEEKSNRPHNEREHSGAEVHEHGVPSLEVLDAAAEGYYDLDCEPQAKRQALMPHALPTGYALDAFSPQLSSNSFLGRQMQLMLPPTPTIWKSPFSPTWTDGHRSNVHLNLSSSSQDGMPHNGYGDPRSFMYSGGLGTTSNQAQFVPRSFGGPLQYPLPFPYMQRATDRTLLGSSSSPAPMVAYEQGRRSPSNLRMKPFLYAPHSSQDQNGINPHHSGLPSTTSPYVPSYVGSHNLETAGYRSFAPPYDRRTSLPLPPKGLFTVPTKPRRTQPLAKDVELINPNNDQPHILVDRLIITGKGGITVVDHRWASTQRVATKTALSTEEPPPPVTRVKQVDISSVSTENAELPTRTRLPRKCTTKMDLLQEKSSTKIPDPGFVLDSRKRRRPTTDEQQSKPDWSPSVFIPIDTSRLGKLSPSEQQSSSGRVTEAHSQSLEATSPTATDLVPKRRTSSNSRALEVRTSKAPGSWPGSSKEMLPPAAFLPGPKSPTERNSFAAVVPRSNKNTAVGSSIFASGTVASSSPLSSAPTTPEPEVAPMLYTAPSKAVTRPPYITISPTVQIDNSPERAISSAPLRDLQPSSAFNLASMKVSPLQTQVSSLPGSSPSTNAKKRKSLLPKQLRRSDRLKTVNNPPLNEDCVIAYAETRDKDNEQGVLRQIKGERQGVFQEEYVVFATRFFIAGD